MSQARKAPARGLYKDSLEDSFDLPCYLEVGLHRILAASPPLASPISILNLNEALSHTTDILPHPFSFIYSPVELPGRLWSVPDIENI